MPVQPANPAGRFNPLMAYSYSIADILAYIKRGEITITMLNQVRSVSGFAFSDLLELLTAEVTSMEELRGCGVPSDMIARLQESLMIVQIQKLEWEKVKGSDSVEELRRFLSNFPQGPYARRAQERLDTLLDEADWTYATAKRTISSYSLYVTDHPEGAHYAEAMAMIKKIETEEADLTAELLEDMRQRPGKYPPSKMRQILRGYDTGVAAVSLTEDQFERAEPADKFLARGFRLDFRTLIDNNIIPPYFEEKDIVTEEYQLPQNQDFSNFPLDRTDVFFLGAPRSGKSTVLSGLFHSMDRMGKWSYQVNIDPKTGKDPSQDYYRGLLGAVVARKPPVSTGLDTISYINMDVPLDESRRGRKAKLNFVELSGEAVKTMANSLSTGDSAVKVWDDLGASRVLSNKNNKILFFLLDYDVILGNQDGFSAFDQEQTLKTALRVLTHDGGGKDYTRDCTFSKVDSVAVILTKADLMGTDDLKERQQIAIDYLENNFRSFMNQLSDYCDLYRRSHPNLQPYVFTFSVGKFYIGNTMDFDDRDTKRLAGIIEDLVNTRTPGIFQ